MELVGKRVVSLLLYGMNNTYTDWDDSDRRQEAETYYTMVWDDLDHTIRYMKRMGEHPQIREHLQKARAALEELDEVQGYLTILGVRSGEESDKEAEDYDREMGISS